MQKAALDERRAVHLREWARQRARADSGERAAAASNPAAAGRWTLVDQIERGGRRYILARDNAPHLRSAAPLSAREQQAAALAARGLRGKAIARELGVADSTARVLLARAAAKLGAATRAELITRLQAHGPRAPADLS